MTKIDMKKKDFEIVKANNETRTVLMGIFWTLRKLYLRTPTSNQVLFDRIVKASYRWVSR